MAWTVSAQARTGTSIAKPTGLSNGDDVLVFINAESTATPAITGFSTLVARINGGAAPQTTSMVALVKRNVTAASEPANYTLTGGTIYDSVIVRVTGADTTTLVDTSVTGTATGAGSSLTATAITPGVDDGLLIRVGAVWDDSAGFTVTSGYTLVVSRAAGDDVVFEHKALTGQNGVSQGTAAITGATSTTWAFMSIVLKPAAATGITGTGADTLGDVTSAAVGSVANVGSGANTLPDTTSAGVGTQTNTGTAANTLDDVTSAGAGDPGGTTITGTGANTLADVTSAAAGTPRAHIYTFANPTAGALTTPTTISCTFTVANNTHQVTGVRYWSPGTATKVGRTATFDNTVVNLKTPTLPDLSSPGWNEVLFTTPQIVVAGTTYRVFINLATSATPDYGSVARTFPYTTGDFTMTANSIQTGGTANTYYGVDVIYEDAPQNGAGADTLDPVTSAGVGSMPLVGTGANTLDDVTSAGTGSAALVGTGANTLDDVTSAGAGALGIAGSSAITLDDVTSAAVGAVAIVGSSAIVLDDVTPAGAGTHVNTATATITLDPVVSAAVASNIVPTVPGDTRLRLTSGGTTVDLTGGNGPSITLSLN